MSQSQCLSPQTKSFPYFFHLSDPSPHHPPLIATISCYVFICNTPYFRPILPMLNMDTLLRPALLHYAQQGKMKDLRAICCKTAEEKPDPAARVQTWVINMVQSLK